MPSLTRITALSALSFAVLIAPATAQDLETLRPVADQGAAERAKLAQVIVDSVFSFGELGFQEVETSRYLTGVLRDNGFEVEEGIAGIPTAWMARWGSGSPVIALGSDIDGIPKASQKPGVAYFDPLVEGAPGHGEGHNSGQAVIIVGALAAKEVMEREGIPGTIVIWPGVAEELLATKAWFIRAGYFDDIDVNIFTHVASDFGVSWGQGRGSGLVSVEYTFEGESAHSAGAPWRGRSALDAVEIMNMAWNVKREHLRLPHRSHYVISNGGDQPNVVPQLASVWYYFRELDQPHMKELYELGNTMAEAAAAMTSTKASWRILGHAYPRHFNKPVAEVVWANIERVGLPEWSEADQTLARGLQRELGVEERGLVMELGRMGGPAPEPRLGGFSDDIGDISWKVPDRHDALSGEHPGRPGPPLGERGGDGDADRAQGRDGGRAGDRHDPDGLVPRSVSGGGGEGLFRRADGGASVQPADRAERPAGDPPQQGADGCVPGGDAAVLLRPGALRQLPGAARDRVPDGQTGRAGRAIARRRSLQQIKSRPIVAASSSTGRQLCSNQICTCRSAGIRTAEAYGCVQRNSGPSLTQSYVGGSSPG